MELRQLKYFLKAKEMMNFTEAAHSLHISQSTLSHQIMQLEEELNVPLFNRIGKRIVLTEAGELFADYAAQSVNRAQDGLLLLKDLNNLQTGKLYIGVTYALRNLFTKTFIQFAKLYPGIETVISFGTSDELIDKLQQSKLDFILSFNDDVSAQQFRYQALFSSRMTLVTSKKSDLKARSSITLKEVARLPLALPSMGYSTTRFLNDAFKKNKLKPTIGVEINDIPTLLELVKTGNWCTVLTEASVQATDLLTIPIAGKKMARTAMVIAIKDAYEKKAFKQFTKLLMQGNNLPQ